MWASQVSLRPFEEILFGDATQTSVMTTCLPNLGIMMVNVDVDGEVLDFIDHNIYKYKACGLC